MKKLFLILAGIAILIFTFSFLSASDVLVWQGQYYTGTTFNVGTYPFNFTVYDNLTAGNICYSNTVNLTTGNWGEWKTEQSNVGASCNNASQDYYLNINIEGANQIPRRRLTVWNFLRKDTDETVSGKLKINAEIVAPIINATSIKAKELNITSSANILGTLRGHSPLKIGDSIQFVNTSDSNLFSIYTAGQNITGSNVTSQYYGVIIHQIETHTNPSGIEECWWDREDQEMRMCMDKANIEMWNSLLVNKNANITGNLTAGKFIGDGSLLTNLPLAPNYLSNNLNASNANYASVFNITLTPNKLNITKAHLVQSSSRSGAAIQNRVIVNNSGPVGYCHFTTQTQAGTEVTDNIAVSNVSADTGVTAMGLDIEIPFLNTVDCTILADANPRTLAVQFQSETVANVTTYAGSYYTKAVN